MRDLSARQKVWNAAFAVLDGTTHDAHDLATRIADRYDEIGKSHRRSRVVPEATREAIKSDLIKGYWTYAQMRERHGVGTSTVQRLAQELRQRGATVHTVGSRNDGRSYPHTRHTN